MSNSRLPQLDFLRALAVLLVLSCHTGTAPENISYVPLKLLLTAGWIGVDLFFVLSGFLVSGLVIKEYEKDQAFDAWRFFVRRGFKIYPAYYVFLVAALPTLTWISHRVSWQSFLAQALFIQNHCPGIIWWHTWSLAVEEQFYILFCLGFFILSRRTNPLQLLAPICLACCLLCPFMRMLKFCQLESTGLHCFWQMPMFTGTLFRLDALVFGVWLSLIYHRDPKRLEVLVKKHWIWLLVAGFGLIAPCALFGYTTFFQYVFGLTMLYLGWGSILLVCLLQMPAMNKGMMGLLSRTGRYSYSIYLWHGPLMAIYILPACAWMPPGLKSLMFLTSSILVGTLMANLIELPMLKLRDRFYPSRSKREDRTAVEEHQFVRWTRQSWQTVGNLPDNMVVAPAPGLQAPYRQ